MTKLRISIVLAIVLFISACNAPVTASAPEQPPTPFPDTPAPAQINAPLIEAPSLVKIYFLNELDGWGVTETQIVRTNDGGITWYNVTPPDVTETGYSVGLSVLDNQHVWMQKPDFNNYPNSGFLYRTIDGGITWTTITVPFSGARITFLDADNGWALADLSAGAGSNAVAVYQTTDSGATWNQKYINDPNAPNAGTSLPLGGLKNGLVPLNMQTAWVYGVTYSTGTIYLYRTDDGGVNWALISSLPLPQGKENTELGVDADHMKLVSATDGFITVRFAGDVMQTATYISADAGNTWSLTPTLISGSGSVDFLSATEMILYNGEQFYVTHDAAHTWNIIPPNIVFGDAFAMMDFVNTSTGWVITQDPTNHRSLYRTTDGGSTWSPVIP